MQVILMERIEKLGQMGDVVTVKPGYARNFLLPQGKARRATQENLDRFEQQRAQLEAENLQGRAEAEKIGAKLRGLMVTRIRQAGDSGHLYGSVNARSLAEAVTEAGFTISHDQISRDKPIKAIGLHPVNIRLHPEVTVTVTANVARSEAEVAAQVSAGHVVSAEQERAADAATAAETEAALAQIATEEAEAEALVAAAAAQPSAEAADEVAGDGSAKDDSEAEAKEG